MKLLIPMATIIHNATPQMVDQRPIFWARLLFMGGDMRVPNPNKFNGDFTNVEVEVTLKVAGKVYQDRETKQVSGSTSLQLSAVSVLKATPVAVAK